MKKKNDGAKMPKRKSINGKEEKKIERKKRKIKQSKITN